MEDLQTGEIIVQGQPAGRGIAIGEVFVLDIKQKTVVPTSITKSSVKANKSRFVEAKQQFLLELDNLGQELNDPGSADIIETQLQIIKDPEIEKNVYDVIEDKLLSVDFAVYQTFCQFIERLKESGSELFRQRIIDLEDIRDRFISLIHDDQKSSPVKKGSIIITSEISPTDLVSYYENGISGLVMDKGGVTSHAAIIAQSLGIPCVVSTRKAVKEAEHSKTVIIDGSMGQVLFNPDKNRINQYKKKLREFKKKVKHTAENGVFETKDGFPFRLSANIEFTAELPKLKEFSAQGVGLLRTESLLFGKRIKKSEEEQTAFYSEIMEADPGPLTIRLFDAGGDKTSIHPMKEANPFLGWRGVRMLLDEKELLRNQLRAILLTAGKNPGKVKILVPMISVIEEVREIRKEIENIQSDLLSEGEKIDENVPLGLMVEVPSVALSAYQFAKEVDFFSMGTNDLTQYTMAADRGNEHICELFQHYHPSVLRMIKLTVEGALKADIEVSACGELAGEEIGAACLYGLGINELSMVPHSIPVIKDLLTSHTKKDFEDLAVDAVNATTSKEVEQLFNNWKNI
ncbi:MAG: phosphoenolpyruvate--protein phosphotransferase [Balneolaceae bacterium]